MNQNQPKVPKLRFPEFDEAWSDKNVADIGNFLRGSNISKEDIVKDGTNECIRYGELYTTYKEIINKVISRTNLTKSKSLLSKKGDLLIPSSGETAEEISTISCLQKSEVMLGGDLNILRLLSENEGVFWSYYLRNYKWIDMARLAQGFSVVHLYASHLKKINVMSPNYIEQQKIASFLSKVDEWIENLKKQKEEWEKYKKGMMQKIFGQKVRFKDENGKEFPEWKTKELGDLGKFKSGVGFPDKEQGGNKGTPFYKVSDMNSVGNENQMIKANNYMKQEQISRLKLKIFNNESIIFAKVGAAVFLERKRIAKVFLIDNNMMAFTPSVDVKFAKYLLDNTRISKFAQTGALPSFNESDIAIIKFKVPISGQEMQKIVEFLTFVDNVIESKQKQISLAENWKKGLMQRIFI